ncbi:TetR/AcrR family transcriptional regulator, partial [Cupriavidus basilensis]
MNQPTPRKRLSREQSQAQTRERLLEATRRLFVQRFRRHRSGISQRAGYSQGTRSTRTSLTRRRCCSTCCAATWKPRARQLATVFDTAERQAARCSRAWMPGPRRSAESGLGHALDRAANARQSQPGVRRRVSHTVWET